MECWHWPPFYNDDYIPDTEQKYWFPERETMDPEKREERILARIQNIMRYCHEQSPFYHRKWREAGLEPGDIKTFEDFDQVPVVTKEELRQSQANHPPFGDYLCIPEDKVARVHGTSGTTGRPTAFAIGGEDWRAISNAHARIMWGMGIRPTDVIFIGSVFSLYMGSWGALAGAERLGAAAFPFGAGIPGQTLRAVNWMLQMKPSVFYGTPSYALRLADVAKENGIDPHDFGIRKLFFSGEPGASIPSIREKIGNAYSGEVFDSGSMGEVTPWMNIAESTGHAGMLCWQDVVYTEVVNPDTYQRVPFGKEGTPIYTTLERASQPMIRLLSGDLTRWEAGPSPCGRTYPILPRGIYGRIDDQFTIRGENIYPSSIDAILSAEKFYGGEHRIIISREETMDMLAVQVEYSDEIEGSSQQIDTLRRTFEEKLHTTLGVRAQVQLVPPNTFERTEFKARRVIDHRDLFREVLES